MVRVFAGNAIASPAITAISYKLVFRTWRSSARSACTNFNMAGSDDPSEGRCGHRCRAHQIWNGDSNIR